jgi:hypothetical protein
MSATEIINELPSMGSDHRLGWCRDAGQDRSATLRPPFPVPPRGRTTAWAGAGTKSKPVTAGRRISPETKKPAK